MPKALKKQRTLRNRITKGERVGRWLVRSAGTVVPDIANVVMVANRFRANLIQYWSDARGLEDAIDEDLLRLVYRETEPINRLDDTNTIKYLVVDVYGKDDKTPIGQARIRQWLVRGQPRDGRLDTVMIGGRVVYQAPGR